MYLPIISPGTPVWMVYRSDMLLEELNFTSCAVLYLYIAGVDFTPTPSGGSLHSFPENSTVTELCVDVILDDVACENPEDFRIRLISLNPAISTVCSTEAIVTIRDSTSKTV